MRVLAFVLLTAGLLGAVPRQSSEPVLQQLLASGRDADLRWPDLSDVQADLTTLYARRDWSPVWFRDDTLVASARSLLRTLQEAPVRGLVAEDYDAPWLALQVARSDTAMILRTDLAFSVAAARFALALRRGRVTPTSVDTSFHLTVDSFDLAGTVQELAASDEPNDVLRRLEPPFLHYWLLMGALVRYRQLSQEYSS